MKGSRSLKQRIARAFVCLAVLLATFFSLVAYVSVEVIEAQVVDAQFEKTADKLIRQHMRNENVDTPPDIAFFTNDRIPAELRQKLTGIYDLMLDGREVQALIREENGTRFAVVQDAGEFEHTELIIFSALGAGFVSSVLLAIVLGLATARHIVAPVSELASAVDRNTRPTELPSLDAQDEIGVLARAFAKRTEDLEQFLLRERLFTGDVSHELRTPLTIILGAAEVLKAQLADHPAQHAVAERVRRVAAETAERVSALLLLSRSPELLDTPHTELNPLIQSEFERCQPLLIGKPVQCRLELSGQVWVQARPELIGIVVGNLIRNACQHTDKGSILVCLSSNQLIIEDQGLGIPAAVRERMFERFVRGNADSADGTGLGLSIVKRVVEHIGWQIRLELPEGGGSRFVLSFASSKFRQEEPTAA
ncbi:MAG: colS1 [Herminiimonas sp.]|nr:colS1 [Herminiimonas sp.]